jgi:hypothetical protein
MSKFNKPATRPAVTSPITTEATPRTRTAEGGPGYLRDTKSELFLLSVANMVAEDTFYERARDRDDRYTALVRQLAVADPAWTGDFLRWLRSDANMRSASLVGAAEFVHARLANGGAQQLPRQDHVTEGTDSLAYSTGANRRVVADVLQRADEPGEFLAYWTSRYGRALPKPVKRGVGDAVRRLYSEYALLKYDTASKGFRFGDVLELTHPEPSTPQQGHLFRVALDRRHSRENTTIQGALTMLVANLQLRLEANEHPSVLLDAERLREAGMTWEDVLSLAGSRLDKAALWTALIPSMAYMALLRNLRNFDEAGLPDDVAATVAARLVDPEQVARSRQLPYRFLSAYRAVSNLRWSHPLEKALNLSLANIPQLPGRTLILVDRSPSMFPHYLHMHAPQVQERVKKTGITLADQAALFGAALALRCADALVVQYGARSEEVDIPRGGSVLPLLARFTEIGGTETFAAMQTHFRGHDRVVILTDEQTRGGADPTPAGVPVYTWNLGGYQAGHMAGGRNRHTFGGLTDGAFKMIPLLEAGKSQSWPWSG